MSRIQLIAKMLVTLLGICAVTLFLGYVDFFITSTSDAQSLNRIIANLFPLVIIGFIFWYMILNNDWLTKKLVPQLADDDAINTEQFIRILRTVMIFAGLMLLPKAFKYLKFLPGLPISLRALIHVSLGLDRYSHQLPQNPWYWVDVTRVIISLLLIIYLICGAPRYVRWQVRKYCC